MIPSRDQVVLWDIALSDEGDLIIGEDGDLAVHLNELCLMDNIRWRMQTALGDWVLEPKCGASLVDYVGMPNTPETAEAILDAVDYAFSHDGYLGPDDYQLDVIPLSENTMGIYLTVNTDFGSLQVVFEFDLLDGSLQIVRLD